MKTATMSTAECEATIGQRGHIHVNTENRREVRKWLNSQGFPALFSGGLSMRELQLAYNDTSGREVGKLRRKLAEASENVSAQETAQSGLLSSIANTGGMGAAAQTAAINEAQANADMAAAEAKALSLAGEMLEHEHKAGNGSDVTQAAKALAEALAKASGKATVNADEVRHIVKDELKDLDKKLKSLTTTTIEVKFPDREEITKLEGRHHPKFETFLKAAASREVNGFRPNIMLSGPAGSGKTFAAKNVVKALGLAWEYNGALSMAHEVLGYQDAAGVYHETSFFRGYTKASGYVFDEVDGSDNSPLLALNAALANGTASFPHGMFARHPQLADHCHGQYMGPWRDRRLCRALEARRCIPLAFPDSHSLGL